MAASSLSCGTRDPPLRHAGFSLVVVHGLQSMWAPKLWHVGTLVVAYGLSSCGVWAPQHVGSVVAACGLSCPAACGILVPRPGMEPVSPALEGRFLTTGPPGKSRAQFLMRFF